MRGLLRSRYVSGLITFAAAVTYVAIMVRRYMVPFAYDRMYDCHYDGSMAWLLGEDYDPSAVLDACQASVHRGAEFTGWLCVAFVVLGATTALIWLTDCFIREAWAARNRGCRGRTRRLDEIRTWCGIAMIFVGSWVIWLLWPLF